MKIPAHKKAFTLVEVMITLVIFVVMIQAIYVTVEVSQRSLKDYAQSTAPKENLRATLAALVKEIRGATNIFVQKQEHSLTMTFVNPVYGNIKYIWSDEGDDAGKIIRTDNSTTSVLARNITSLSFTQPFSNNQIIIDIADGNAGQGTAMELKEKVALRMQTGLY